VDTCCLAFEVKIKRTNDDAGVAGVGFVQRHEMFPIQRHDGTLVGGSQFKDRLVRDRLPRLTDFGKCDYVVAEMTQRLDDWERKVLIGE
jgi:hypothetical protein